MIRHIVMWKFADEAMGKSKAENMENIRTRLLALRDIVPEIRGMEIGKDILHSEMSYDMALYMTFDSLEALETYKVHPEHKKISAFVKEVRIARACVDFEIEG